MANFKDARRGRIGAAVARPTSWWLATLRRRAENMYAHDNDPLPPVVFSSDAERLACISFFTAAPRAEESGSSQAGRLADDVRPWDPELAECLTLYGNEEQWHRGLVERLLAHLGASVQPLGGLTKILYNSYARARDLETIMLTNLMFEVIGSTTYRIALGRVAQPALRRMLTILARDESFHVPLNVHFIREMQRHRGPSLYRKAKLQAIYRLVFWTLIASSAASRRVAQPFDAITFAELSRAYAENLSRLFLHEADLRFTPPPLALKLFKLRRDELLAGDDLLSAAAAEAAADRDQVHIGALSL
jgi:hypothetical protein